MKIWPVIFGIVIILTLVCSPAFAISKSDLISYYKGQSAPTIPTPAMSMEEVKEQHHGYPEYPSNPGASYSVILSPDSTCEEEKTLLLQKLQTKKRIVDADSGHETFFVDNSFTW